MNEENRNQYVLALSAHPRGIGYVLLYGAYPLRLNDWGVTRSSGRRKNEKMLQFVKGLLRKYVCRTVVLEDWMHAPRRRSQRIHALCSQIVSVAQRAGVPVELVSRESIQNCFWEVPPTRYNIALAIAKDFHELQSAVPPNRALWVTQDHRQALYDAAAVGITYYTTHDFQDSVVEV